MATTKTTTRKTTKATKATATTNSNLEAQVEALTATVNNLQAQVNALTATNNNDAGTTTQNNNPQLREQVVSALRSMGAREWMLKKAGLKG